MKVILKIIFKLRSLLTVFKYKLLYGQRFQVPFNVDIKPSLKVRIYGGEVKIGKRCVFRENICINVTGGSIVIGDECFFNDFVCINSRELITIGSKSIFGQGVKLYDHDHDFRSTNVQNNFICSSVMIDENVWIGSNATILRGSKIGKNSVIGANTLLKNTLDDYTLYYNKIHPCIERINLKNA